MEPLLPTRSSPTATAAEDAVVPELEIKTKTVPKPMLKQKLPSKPPSGRKTVVLEPPKEAITAPQSLPKASEQAWPFPTPRTAPEPVKTVPETPAAPPSPPPLQKMDKFPELTPIPKHGATPAAPTAPSGPPPLVPMPRNPAPTVAPTPAPTPAPTVPPGPPPIMVMPRAQVVKVDPKAPEPLIQVMRKDDMYAIIGIHNNGETHLHGLYTRSHVNGLPGEGFTERMTHLIHGLYTNDDRNIDWVRRSKQGYCEFRRQNPPDHNPFNVVYKVYIRDSDANNGRAMWDSDEGSQQPYNVYKYVVVKVGMNEVIPVIPFNLI